MNPHVLLKQKSLTYSDSSLENASLEAQQQELACEKLIEMWHCGQWTPLGDTWGSSSQGKDQHAFVDSSVHFGS